MRRLAAAEDVARLAGHSRAVMALWRREIMASSKENRRDAGSRMCAIDTYVALV